MTTTAYEAPHAGACPHCGRDTGNTTRHTPACGRDRAIIERAGAHAADPEGLHPSARFRGATTDLDVARLLRALESGVVVYPERDTFKADGNLPLPALRRTVTECLRVGLVHITSERLGPSVWRTRVVPAITHAHHPIDPNRPACRVDRVPGIKRWRLLADLTLVDCQACVDALSEA